MRKLATIQIVRDVQPIEKADAIEKIQVKDWWCVAKKGEFRAGERCVYFEIDSLLPSANPAFAFLAKGSSQRTMLVEGGSVTGYRLKTVKLRGQISQGLALPLEMVGLEGREVGEDVSEALGIYKWEPPMPARLAAIAKGPFPGFIPKTDEERVQNLGDVIRRHAGEAFYVTEKLDGTSSTFYRWRDQFGACSRNLDLREGNVYWEVAGALGLIESLPDGMVVQGEIIGEGIQGNPLRRKGQEFYAFNVFDIRMNSFLSFAEAEAFCRSLGVNFVPVISRDYRLSADVQEILKMADGKSQLCAEADREGLVFRPLVEQRTEVDGHTMRLSFKAISNKYLLQHDG
jgi:RNA ligase (TIGR02306 family)